MDFFKSVKGILAFVSGIQVSKSFEGILPKSAVGNINSNLDNLDAQIVSIIQSISAYSPYTITQYDYQNIQMYFSNGTAVQIASQIQSIKSYSDNFFNILPQLYPFIRANNFLDFSSLTDSISKDREIVSKIRSDTQQSMTEIQDIIQSSKDNLNTIRSISEEVKSDKEIIEERQARAQEILIKLETISSSVDKTYGEAESLGGKMEVYRKEFLEFESKIEVTTAHLDELKDLAVQVEKINSVRESDIERIKLEAESMLVGATNVGLAKHFNDTYVEYKNLANSALNSFHLSIFTFFIATAITLLFIIPTLGDKTSTIYGVLVKTIILIPAIWYLAFSSRRYGTLFSLQKQYKHKAAIAQSIEGFKKEAENHKQDITAAIFMELAKDPDAHESSEIISKQDGNFVKKNFSQAVEAMRVNKGS